MSRIKSVYHLIAQNPDGRRKDLFFATYNSKEEVQQQIAARDIDAEHAKVFFGGELLPIKTKMLVVIGEEQRRRGRPLGSKNKPKNAKAKTVQSLLKKKEEKRAVKKRNGLKKRPAPVVEIVAGQANGVRGRRAKETQAERNTRVESTT